MDERTGVEATAETGAADTGAEGTAEALYGDVLDDDRKKALTEEAKADYEDVKRTLVEEHYKISQLPVRTPEQEGRLTEIDSKLAEIQRAEEGLDG